MPLLSDLNPTLTRVNATAMVAGTIIGAAIFVQPSEIARYLETPAQIMLVWLACGVLTLFGAFVCAELASAFPQTGGLYIFLRDTFSPVAGFLWGWAMFWTMHSGIIAVIAMVCARYVGSFVETGPAGTRAIARGGHPRAHRGQLRRRGNRQPGSDRDNRRQAPRDCGTGGRRLRVCRWSRLRPERRRRRPSPSATSFSPWSRGCSRTADGTW